MDNKFMYIKNEHYISGTSYPEQFLYRALSQIYYAENRKHESGYEFDISIQALNLKIEYNGLYWHIGKEVIEEHKRNYCKKKLINYIEIIECCEKIKPTYVVNDLHIQVYIYGQSSFLKRNEQLIEVLDFILKRYGHSIAEINIEQAIYESFIFCKKYNYNVTKKNEKIIGTENKLYKAEANDIEINKEEKIDQDIKTIISDDVELVSKVNDITLVNNKMSKKQFDRHCRRIIKNWNNSF